MRGTIAPGAALLALWAGLSGCSARSDGKAQDGKEAARPPVAVEAGQARGSEITEGIDVVGTLVPRFDAEVKSEVSGKVSEVLVTEWVRVRKGTPLARVDTSEGEVIVQKAQAAVVAKASGRPFPVASRLAWSSASHDLFPVTRGRLSRSVGTARSSLSC